jgi:lipoprotein-anchoring transpeptidase ErfK/SrfK
MKHAVLAAFFAISFGASAGYAATGVLIAVDERSQTMSVAVDGMVTYRWKVSTGRAGYDTPTGTFTPFRMERDHFSKEWDDAPMPYSIFFTPDGHAIHGSFETRRLGRAVSHGCIRLDPRNAAVLYDLVTAEGLENTKVVVSRGDLSTIAQTQGTQPLAQPWPLAPLPKPLKQLASSPTSGELY